MASMSKDEIMAKLKPVIAEQLGVDESEVTDTASFTEDLNADSLDLVELIMSLEEQFGLQISDEDAEKLTTVGEAVDYIYEHTNYPRFATIHADCTARFAGRRDAGCANTSLCAFRFSSTFSSILACHSRQSLACQPPNRTARVARTLPLAAQ